MSEEYIYKIDEDGRGDQPIELDQLDEIIRIIKIKLKFAEDGRKGVKRKVDEFLKIQKSDPNSPALDNLRRSIQSSMRLIRSRTGISGV